MDKPPPLKRNYSRDPNIEALKKEGAINHGFTLHSKLFEHSVSASGEGGVLRLNACACIHSMKVRSVGNPPMI